MVTLEDLIEEIVGEISDEDEIIKHDNIVKIAENTYICDARMEIEEVERFFDVELPPGNYETLAGLVINAFGKMPQIGESFQIDFMEITVQEADEKSVKKVKISVSDKTTNSENNE